MIYQSFKKNFYKNRKDQFSLYLSSNLKEIELRALDKLINSKFFR